jgi:positive regulator of sigma E activity
MAGEAWAIQRSTDEQTTPILQTSDTACGTGLVSEFERRIAHYWTVHLNSSVEVNDLQRQ